jgi:glucose/arabinose dehydrogenase
VLSNGDVLVAETNRPPEQGSGFSLRGIVQSAAQKTAGAATKSPNRISLLRDADGDGRAETRTIFLQGLNSPFGMTLVGNTLYVANTDAIVAFPRGATRISARGQKIADLPAGPITGPRT